MNFPETTRPYPPTPWAPCGLKIRRCIFAATLALLPIGFPVAGIAQVPADIPDKSRQELDSIFQDRLRGQPAATLGNAEVQFLTHLKETSPIIAESLLQGRMSEDDLASRVDIFIGDHPEFLGKQVSHSMADPRARVSGLLTSATDLASKAGGVEALSDQFIAHLGEVSGTARSELLSGKMSDDDLKSRVGVFLDGLRAEAQRSSVDPSLAAAGPVVDAYLKANFGGTTAQMSSICFRGTVEDGKAKVEFVIFKMRPRLLRIHIVRGDIVAGVMGFDGNSAWIQKPGRLPVDAAGAEAAEIARASRFDDPLIGFRDRGAEVRLLGRKDGEPYSLGIRESDGSELVVVLDPATYEQTSIRSRRPDGKWNESKFNDYRLIGSTKVAFTREDMEDGVLHSTTHYSDVRLDPGLVEKFFERPKVLAFDFMDFMGGLAVLEARSKQAAEKGGPSK